MNSYDIFGILMFIIGTIAWGFYFYTKNTPIKGN